MLFFPLGCDHLRADAQAEGIPEDPDPSGPRTGEEVLWQARRLCRRTQDPAQANAQHPQSAQAEAATFPNPHLGLRCDSRGSRLPRRDCRQARSRQARRFPADQGPFGQEPADDHRTQSRHIHIRLQEVDRTCR